MTSPAISDGLARLNLGLLIGVPLQFLDKQLDEALKAVAKAADASRSMSKASDRLAAFSAALHKSDYQIGEGISAVKCDPVTFDLAVFDRGQFQHVSFVAMQASAMLWGTKAKPAFKAKELDSYLKALGNDSLEAQIVVILQKAMPQGQQRLILRVQEVEDAMTLLAAYGDFVPLPGYLFMSDERFNRIVRELHPIPVTPFRFRAELSRDFADNESNGSEQRRFELGEAYIFEELARRVSGLDGK